MANWHQYTLDFDTSGRSIVEISAQVQQIIDQTQLSTGLTHLFLKHTSASLMLCENAYSLGIDH